MTSPSAGSSSYSPTELHDVVDAVFGKLRATLDCVDQTRRRLFSASTHGLGVWQPGDEVRLVCIADLTPSTFWLLAAEKLDTEDLHPKNDSAQLPLSLGIFDDFNTTALSASRTKMYLSYCGLSSPIDLCVGDVRLPAYSNYRQSGSPGKILNTVRDMHYILDTLGKHMPAFREAYSRLHDWAHNHGILGDHLGLLSSEQLLLMLFELVSTDQISSVELDTSKVVRMFCSAFSTTSFQDKVFGVVEQGQRLPQRPTTPMAVRTYHAPSGNRAVHVNKNGARVIAQAMNLGLRAYDAEWTQAECFNDFMSRRSHFICLRTDHWAQSPDKAKAFNTRVAEKILPGLVKELDLTDHAFLHVWPEPLQACERSASKEIVHLVGLADEPSASLQLGKPELTAISHLVSSYFSDNAVLDAKIDTTSEFLDYKIVRSEHLFDEKTKAPLLRPMPTASLPARLPEAAGDHSVEYADRSEDHGDGSAAAAQQPQRSDTKLRSAAAVLSRLQWDPELRHQDYEVGYLDRFEGIKWQALGQWRKDVSHDEYIPDHRIRLFRRVRDGKVMWDRERRVDSTDGR